VGHGEACLRRDIELSGVGWVVDDVRLPGRGVGDETRRVEGVGGGRAGRIMSEQIFPCSPVSSSASQEDCNGEAKKP